MRRLRFKKVTEIRSLRYVQFEIEKNSWADNESFENSLICCWKVFDENLKSIARNKPFSRAMEIRQSGSNL